MNNSSIYKKIENAPKARTNMLKITSPNNEVISSLLKSEKYGTLGYSIKELKRIKDEKSKAYYLRMDREIKDIIREKISLDSNEIVTYERVNLFTGMVMFFYISNRPCSPEVLFSDIKKHGFNVVKVIEKLMFLRLKQTYLKDASKFYNIEPALFNTELYIGAMVGKSKKAAMEALRPHLYFSERGELSLKLSKKLFKYDQDDMFVAGSSNHTIMFRHGKKSYAVEGELNSISSKRPYMNFPSSQSDNSNPHSFTDNYRNSINYHLTMTQDKLKEALKSAGIAFEDILFEASHVVDHFVELNGDIENELIIIDQYKEYPSKEIMHLFREHLKAQFGASEIIDAAEAPIPTALNQPGTSYLVVNKSEKDNGSSIVRLDEDKVLNSFGKALDLHLSKTKNVTFDYYTQVKLDRFTNKKLSITQGMNIESVVNSTDTDAIEPISPHKVQKIMMELLLKEKVFGNKLINGISLPTADLTLIYARKTNYNGFISVVKVTTSEEGIKIHDNTMYSDKEKPVFNFEHRYLKPIITSKKGSIFDDIHDGSFYIIDNKTKQTLISYSTDSVANIIGNSIINNIEESRNLGGIHRAHKGKTPILPYYVIGKFDGQRYRVFLEDCGVEGVRYFVSSNKAPKGQIMKQVRNQNILVFSENGEKKEPLQQFITELFLQSFTFDMLNNEESSKKSIFVKIAELYIEN